MPLSRLQRAVRVCIGNPFSIPAERWQRAAHTILQTNVDEVVADSLAAGRLEAAVTIPLALGHLQACARRKPTRVLTPSSISARTFAALPGSRATYLRLVLAAGRCFHGLTAVRGSSRAMQEVRRATWSACFGESLQHALHLESVIRDHDVLILGETGTGKEAIANAILDATPGGADGKPAARAALNVAAVPETLVESELFGHVRGAFTGAQRDRTGAIRIASGGCLFLDEVGDLAGTAQVKLLRVMETDKIRPLGADRIYDVDVRYVAATHRDLAGMVERGQFRRDLYGRLAGNVVTLPPLRERPEDIEEIALAFMEQQMGDRSGALETKRIDRWIRSHEAQGYSWPGNVRELQNALRNLMLGLDSGIARSGMGRQAAQAGRAERNVISDPIATCQASLREANAWYVQRVIEHTDGNIAAAARILGVDRATVRRRLDG